MVGINVVCPAPSLYFILDLQASFASFEFLKRTFFCELTLAYVFNFCFSCQSWAVITIQGNDLMNGEIGFMPGSRTATADEDGAGTGERC